MSAFRDPEDVAKRIESIQWEPDAVAVCALTAEATLDEAIAELPVPWDMDVEVSLLLAGRAGGDERKERFLRVRCVGRNEMAELGRWILEREG